MFLKHNNSFKLKFFSNPKIIPLKFFCFDIVYSSVCHQMPHCNVMFLGAFAKSRKPTVSFVMSGYLSVRPNGTTRLQLGGFL
jgi:hypothetical protein